jgi:hypothetical protein
MSLYAVYMLCSMLCSLCAQALHHVSAYNALKHVLYMYRLAAGRSATEHYTQRSAAVSTTGVHAVL